MKILANYVHDNANYDNRMFELQKPDSKFISVCTESI